MGVSQKVRRVIEEHGLFWTALLCLKLPFSPVLRSPFGVRVHRAYHDWMFDHRYGVETSGFFEPAVSRGGDMGRFYDGTRPAHFRRIVKNLGIRHEEFSFVDFGSGKGRALLLASAFSFRSVAGVEWSEELHEIAEQNIAVYRGPRACAHVESFCIDAAKFPIPEGKSLLYFYNPFKDEIMARVLDNIARSFEAYPREMIIVYVNPKSRGVLDRQPFIRTETDRGWFVVYRTVMPPLFACDPVSGRSGESAVVPPAA
jgi:SAM-dependent methyltransferase